MLPIYQQPHWCLNRSFSFHVEIFGQTCINNNNESIEMIIIETCTVNEYDMVKCNDNKNRNKKIMSSSLKIINEIQMINQHMCL